MQETIKREALRTSAFSWPFHRQRSKYAVRRVVVNSARAGFGILVESIAQAGGDIVGEFFGDASHQRIPGVVQADGEALGEIVLAVIGAGKDIAGMQHGGCV